MATKRSDYLKAMYSKMQNNVDKLSTFSSMNAVGDLNSDIANSISTANSIVNPSHQVKPENDRNWYQRTMDSISDIEYNISNGLFGFFDTIGDFAIDLLFSNEDWAEGAKNYDWVSQASYGTHIMANGMRDMFTGDMFQNGYWDFSPENAARRIEDTRQSSYRNAYDPNVKSYLDSIEASIGNMIPSIALNVATGGSTAGLTAMSVGAGMSSYNEAREDGASKLGALGTGALSGAVEAISEKLVGKALAKIGLGTGNVFGIGKITGSTGGEIAGKLFKTMIEEGTEEVFSKLLEPMTKTLYKGWSALNDYIDEDYWFGGVDSVAGSFVTGAVTGGLFGGISTYNTSKAFTTEGAMALELLDTDIREDLNKLKNYEKGSAEYNEISKRVADNTIKFAELIDKAKSKATKEQLANLQNALRSPEAVARTLTEDDKKFEERITDKMLTANFFDTMQERYGTNYKLEFKDGMTENAQFDKTNGVVYINNNMSDKGVSLVAHEYLGHAINGMTMNDSQINDMFKEVVKTDYFKNNEQKLRKAYTTTEEYKALTSDLKTKYYRTEVINSYIENLVGKLANNEAIKGIESATLKKTLLERIKDIFKSRSSVSKQQEVLGDKIFTNFLKASLKFVNRLDNRVLKVFSKVQRNQKLSKAEQQLFNEYEFMYNRIFNSRNGVDKKELIEYVENVDSEVVENEDVYKAIESNAKDIKDSLYNDLNPFETNQSKKIKQSAQDKVGKYISITDAQKAYDSIVNSVDSVLQQVLGEWDTTTNTEKKARLKLKKGDLKARRLFEEYNLLSPKDEASLKANVGMFVDDLLQQSVLTEDSSVQFTFAEYLERSNVDVAKVQNGLTETLYDMLNGVAKKTITQKTMDNYQRYVNYLLKSKAELQMSFKIAQKINTIKRNLDKKLKVGNTGQLDMTADIRTLFNEYFKKFVFTRHGYISSSNLRRLVELDKNGLFDKIADNIVNVNREGVDVNIYSDQIAYIKEIKNNLIASYNENDIRLNYDQMLMFNELNKTIYSLYNQFSSDVVEQTREQANVLIDRANFVKEQYKSGKQRRLTAVMNDFTSPKTFFARVFGGTYTKEFKSVYNDLILDPYAKQVSDYVDFMKQRDELTKNLQKRSSETITVNGVKMNRYVLYTVYLNSLSPDNLTRMMNGGLAYTNNTTTYFKYDDFKSQLETLSEVEINELNDFFNKIYNGTAKTYVINTSKKVNGFETTRENYYPIVSSDITRNVDLTSGNNLRFSLSAMNNNNLKALSNRKTTIEINLDPQNVFRKYIESMTITNQIGIPSQTLNRLFQLKGKDGKSLKSIVSEYIPNTNEQLQSIVSKLINQKQYLGGDTIFDKIIGHVATAKLSLSLRTMMKQIGSLFTAIEKVGFKTFAKTIFNPTKLSRCISTKARRYLRNNNGIFALRTYENGYYSSQSLNAMSNNLNKFSAKLAKGLMSSIEYIDRFTCYLTFAMQQQYVEQTYGLEIGSEENLKKASYLYSEMLTDTQSNSDRIMLSRVRSGEKGKLTKIMFGMFQSDAQNKLSLLTQHLIDVKFANLDLENATKANDVNLINASKKTLKTAKNGIAACASGIMLSAILAAMVDKLADYIYDKEEPEDTQLLEVLGDVAEETFISYIPYVSSIYNWFKYGSVSNMAVESIQEVVDSVKKLSEGDLTDYRNYLNIAQTALEFLGLPVSNVRKLVEGLLGNFAPDLALQERNLLYGLSTQKLSEWAKSKDIEKSEAAIMFMYSKNKFDISNDVASEIARLTRGGYVLNVPNYKTTKKVGEETVDMTESEINDFKNKYRVASDVLSEIIKSAEYKALTDEQKASLISSVAQACSSYAKEDKKLTTQAVKLKNYARIAVEVQLVKRYLNNKTAVEVYGSNKNAAIRYLNVNCRSLTKNEKLLILMLSGFSLTKEQRENVEKYLSQKSHFKA